MLNGGIVSPSLYANPTLFVIPCKFCGGLRIQSVAIIVSYQAAFHPNFNHP
jgi:hypothetical protein